MENARTSYRENEVRGASPVRLVILEYEQLVQDLRQAMCALEKNEVAERTDYLNHAILVIGHLQSALDFEKGGRAAEALERFYNVLRQNLIQVQFAPSRQGFEQQITDLMSVRDAWLEVDRAEAPAGRATHPAYPGAAEAEPARVDWKG